MVILFWVLGIFAIMVVFSLLAGRFFSLCNKDERNIELLDGTHPYWASSTTFGSALKIQGLYNEDEIAAVVYLVTKVYLANESDECRERMMINYQNRFSINVDDSKRWKAYGAKINNKLLGVIVFSFDESNEAAVIERVAVLEAHRMHGIGHTLIEFCKRHLKHRGATRVTIDDIRTSNACQFLRSCRFSETKEIGHFEMTI